MPNVNYAEQYGKELANAYPYLSYFGDIMNVGEAQRFRPHTGKTVFIPSMRTTGSKSANREQITGVFNRNFSTEWQACTLEMDREWDTLLDPMDIDETNEVATIANIAKTYNELQKIPEQDAYVASKLAGFAAQFGGTDSSSLSSSSILDLWDTYLAYMTDARVNRDRIMCKMTSSAYKLLKEATGLTRFVETTNGIRDVDRNVARLDGVRIAEVPSDLMKTAYDFDVEGGGFAVADGAGQIDILLYDPMAVAVPVIYDSAMISAPTAATKGKWIYYERHYYGAFALNQRGAGFFAHLSAAPSLGTLTVTSVAGSAAGATTITATGKGIGQNGHADDNLEMYITSGNNSAPSVTYGSNLPTAGGVTWTKIAGVPVTLTSQTASKYVTVALVNKVTGKAVAAGSAQEVVGA